MDYYILITGTMNYKIAMIFKYLIIKLNITHLRTKYVPTPSTIEIISSHNLFYFT